MSKLSLVLGCLLAAESFAVKVADCPKKITVEASDFRLTKKVDDLIQDDDFGGMPEEQEKAIRTSYKNLSDKEKVSRSFKLKSAKSGRCIYSGTDLEKIEVFSRSGDDQLYLQTKLGPRGTLLRVYAEVQSLSPEEVKLGKEGRIALAIPRYPYTTYLAGGPLKFVGKAKQVSAE